MNNFELIDDYLANKLKGAEREAFENQLGKDPVLKSEFDLQQNIVEGIKQARAAELKSILSKVPVESGGAQVEFTVLRIAAGVLLAGAISAASYYYFKSHGFPPIENAAADVVKTEEKKGDSNIEATTPKQDLKQEQATPVKPADDATKDAQEAVTPAVKPSLDVVDPSDELSEENQPSSEHLSTTRPEISPSHVQVDLDSSNKKYDFHYQFADEKLMLYGSFDRSLYEVLEVNGGNHALFLFYKNNFYLLDESQTEITKLTPIQDQTLLKKLREYRSR
jgi:hypothetical protein